MNIENDKNKIEKLGIIHTAIFNDKWEEVVKQIDTYGIRNFWRDYQYFLTAQLSGDAPSSYLRRAVIFYHETKYK